MSKNLLKLLLWAAIFAIGTLLSYWLLLGITGLISYFQQGADVSSALHNIPALPSDLTVRWQWLPDDPDTGRQMEPLRAFKSNLPICAPGCSGIYPTPKENLMD